MIDKKILNISREDRDESSIQHHYLKMNLTLHGLILHWNQFILALKDCLQEILNTDYSMDIEIEVEEFSMKEERKNMKSLKLISECTLFDDPSVREKVTIMDKWDAMMDDARNLATYDWLDTVEEFLELGKTYRVTLQIEEVS